MVCYCMMQWTSDTLTGESMRVTKYGIFYVTIVLYDYTRLSLELDSISLSV